MNTPFESVQKFVRAIKLDRHDWEDWPKDSREAYVELVNLVEPPAEPIVKIDLGKSKSDLDTKNCRTCRRTLGQNHFWCVAGNSAENARCTWWEQKP